MSYMAIGHVQQRRRAKPRAPSSQKISSLRDRARSGSYRIHMSRRRAIAKPPLLIGAAHFGLSLVRSRRHMKRVVTTARDGAPLATWAGGPATGRPVVFLHGFCGDHSNMRPIALEVSKRRPVVLYDARGHGSSAGFSGVPTMRQLADDLDAVLAQHAPAGADVAGLSMGAQTVFEYLRARHQPKLHRLVFIDQSPKVLAAEDWPHGLFGQIDRKEVARVRAALQTAPRKLGGAWLKGMWRSNERLTMKLLLSPAMATGLRSVPAPTLRLADDMLKQDWRDVITRIEQPTLLLYGGRSIYPGAGQWMASALPHARYVYFKDSGHALIFEEPRRAATTIARFLA